MKLIALMFINFVAYATAAEQYDISASLDNVESKNNQWLLTLSSAKNSIESVTVEKEITNDEGLSIDYQITDMSDEVLGGGNGPLCSDPESKDGIIVTLMGKVLGVNLECPISEKKGERPDAKVFGKLILDEDPGTDKLFIKISIMKNDASIVTVDLVGKVQ